MRVFAVLRKELSEGARDRRSVLTALFFPILGPLAMWFALSSVVHSVGQPSKTHLGVVGAENAPALVAWLSDRNVEVDTHLDDPAAALGDGRVAAILRIPEGFEDDLRASRPALVEVLSDSSKKEAIGGKRRVENLLEAWSRQVGALRLLARGLAPDVATALKVDDVDLATPERQAGTFLEMLVMIVLIGAFFCNMYVAIDTTAGERERRSMEPLLLTPVPRWALVVGKWAAGALFGGVGVAITVAAMGVVLANLPLEVLGARVDVGFAMGCALFVATLPLVAFAAAFQMLVCSFARSFKEAQTLVSMTTLVGMVPGMILSLHPVAPATWMYGLPVLSQQLLAGAVTRGEPIDLTAHLLGAGSTLGATALCLAGMVALFRSEGFLGR